MLSARIQRIMMGTMILFGVYLLGIDEILMASRLFTAMGVLVFVWAIFDFCPSIWVLQKLFKEDCPLAKAKSQDKE